MQRKRERERKELSGQGSEVSPWEGELLQQTPSTKPRLWCKHLEKQRGSGKATPMSYVMPE